jgi:hypothetical protein
LSNLKKARPGGVDRMSGIKTISSVPKKNTGLFILWNTNEIKSLYENNGGMFLAFKIEGIQDKKGEVQ